MNILIVETVWMGGATYKFLDKTLLTAFSLLPTLQAREIAAITPKNHTVTVINERYTPIDFDKKYDVVHINFVTSTAPHAYDIADTFRKNNVLVVLSGLHASGMPEEAKQHADSVLVGRPELAWLSALQDIEQHKLKPFYQASSFDTTVRLPPTMISLPGFVITGALEATRGCPYQCDFCPETNIPGGSQYYERPIDDVIMEMKTIPQRTLMFYDNSLTIHPDYTKELFRKMRGLHKRFFCNGNVDVLARDTELVQLSKQAGCVAWLIGFESVSQRTLDAIGKKTNRVDEYLQAVNNIHHLGMAVIGCFMFGFDTDTVAVFEETRRVVKKMNLDVADFSILTPFPGTPLFMHLEQQGRILTKDWKQYNLKTVVFTPQQMAPEELLAGIQKMYSDFYNPLSAIKRSFCGLNRGLYTFFTILFRNVIATMNSRRLFIKSGKK